MKGVGLLLVLSSTGMLSGGSHNTSALALLLACSIVFGTVFLLIGLRILLSYWDK